MVINGRELKALDASTEGELAGVIEMVAQGAMMMQEATAEIIRIVQSDVESRVMLVREISHRVHMMYGKHIH
jgi:hypothetical protein